MNEDQIKEIKRKLCENCGDRCCCRGIVSCKDVNIYMAKKGSTIP